MIHYHGTPIGGPKADAARFLAGRHALVPFSYPADAAIVADVCQSFVLDNGAFTAWTQGGEIDRPAYYDWVREWYRHPGFDWALIPDVIDGDEAANDAMLAEWPQDLRIVGVPVWHLHESLERLERLVAGYRVVALGSSGVYRSPGTAVWWGRMGEAMQVACDAQGRPRAKLHGLRMLDPDVFSLLPLSSADSTQAAVNSGAVSRFGSYPAPTRAQRAEVLAARVEAHNSCPVWVSHKQEVLEGVLC